MVGLALVREFVYEYAAVSPWDGCPDYWTTTSINTKNMSRFLDQVRKAHLAGTRSPLASREKRIRHPPFYPSDSAA